VSAQSYKGLGVVVDRKWWKTRWLSSSLNSRACLTLSLAVAACLPLVATAPAACFGLGCLTFGRRLLFLLENTRARPNKATAKLLVHRSFRLSFVFRCIHHLCDYHHCNPTTIITSSCRRPESTASNHVSKPVQCGVGHARQSHPHRLASGAYHSPSQGRSRTFRTTSHPMG
jgi:hypothetical protein